MYYGCKKEIDDKRDYKFSKEHKINAPYIPLRFQLKELPVKDQGIVNSCVAHSLSSFLENDNKDLNLKFSVGFIYGYRPNNYNQEEGMYPREALKTLYHIGDVENKYFNHNLEIPEIENMVNSELTNLLPLSKLHTIKGYARIFSELDIKRCLLKGVAVPASIPIFNNLKFNEKFIINNEGEIDGYHMILIIGWNEDGFIFQNSWGKDWGNNGKAVLPYNYKIDSAWAISTINNNINIYQSISQKIIKIFHSLINWLKGVNK